MQTLDAEEPMSWENPLRGGSSEEVNKISVWKTPWEEGQVVASMGEKGQESCPGMRGIQCLGGGTATNHNMEQHQAGMGAGWVRDSEDFIA
jgi:hypothetical protein